MKQSQKLKACVLLSPAVFDKRVSKMVAALSDEEAVARADQIQSVLTPVMRDLQERYLTGARMEHEASDEKRLVVEHGGKIVAAIQSAIDSLSFGGAADVPSLDENILSLLPGVLSASELLVYPCMEFTETMAARDIVAYGDALAKAVADFPPGEPFPLSEGFIVALRHLTKSDILALRVTTEEYWTQSKIFELLREFCNAASGKLGEMRAADGSLAALGLIQVLDRRSSHYLECLSEDDAAAFAKGLRNIVARLRRQSKCRTNS